MQLCHIHFHQKIARKKVARVNAALWMGIMFIHGLGIFTSYTTILAMVYNYTVGTVTRILLKEVREGAWSYIDWVQKQSYIEFKNNEVNFAFYQICVNSPGSYSCLCRTGYYNESSNCVDISEYWKPVWLGEDWSLNITLMFLCILYKKILFWPSHCRTFVLSALQLINWTTRFAP